MRVDHVADVGRRKCRLFFGHICVSHVGQPEQPDDSEEPQDIGRVSSATTAIVGSSRHWTALNLYLECCEVSRLRQLILV